MSDYNHDQDLLSRRLREVLIEFDFRDMDREEVAEVFEQEVSYIQYGSKEMYHWLEGLEEVEE